MSEIALAPVASRCSSCATELAPALLVCPACHALVHRGRLSELAREADTASDPAQKIAYWREALSLLPAGSRQFTAVAERIDGLTAEMEGKTLAELRQGPAAGTNWAKILGPLGVAGLLIWKLKFLFVALLTKGKLLLLGFTKAGTVASLFVSLGVYWTAWGWKFAAALLAGIYIHEVGHVAELRRRGMRASAPMFIPGVGAFVRMHEHAATPAEDARIGLAGPIWGLGAAIAACAAALATGSKFWMAVAHVTAVINIFNLTPVWQLDGSRGFHPLSRNQRLLAAGAVAAIWALTREGMLVLVALVGIWRAFDKTAGTKNDWGALATYTILAAALAALSYLAK
ncbi:MAG TPA: site-2 protease family protein [Thermoanaerobaculia bacterium]|jgi:Zn-dependent protease